MISSRGFLWSLCGIFFISSIDSSSSGDNLALLSGTLRTYQKASCHQEEWMSLRCPTGTTISVQSAQYGKNSRPPAPCQSVPSSHVDLSNAAESSSSNNSSISCHWPAAIQYSLLQNVVGHCQKKTNCKFQTSPRTFGGDRCPGVRYVEVAFKCRPSEFKSVVGCEDDVIQLKCNRSSRLAIYSANFGRTEYESITCSQPNGVSEETCQASFATETVMQMCHGKRKCALSADPATFGTPCKPESRMYLKVIHTCIPRKVLLEKYQGEADPDEIFEDETEDDGADSSVIEQPSIYSPDHHSKSWPHSKNSSSNGRNSLGQFSEEGNQEEENDDDQEGNNGTSIESNEIIKTSSSVTHDSHTGNSSSINESNDPKDQSYSSQTGVRIVYLLSQGINAYDYITKNSEKFYLYLAISTASLLLLLILLILVKITVQRRRRGNNRNGNNHSGGNTNGGKNSSAAGPILSSNLSDIDDLDLEQNEITFTEVPSILKRSSPYDREHADSRKEIRPLSTVAAGSGSGIATTTLGRSNEVVRFSNTLGRRDRDTNNPKSLKQESKDSNEEFFYG